MTSYGPNLYEKWGFIWKFRVLETYCFIFFQIQKFLRFLSKKNQKLIPIYLFKVNNNTPEIFF